MGRSLGELEQLLLMALLQRDGEASGPALLKLMIESGIDIAKLSVSTPTLDDVFLQYTGRTIRSEQGGGEEFAQSLRPWIGLRGRQ